ncbi:hypothetical protein ACNQR7_32670 [Mycolicibacterium senegalense]|uniref:hypothetical protein n=1 Tax=Mycolicibacterium senegalense TaxID=1796 RepID=UPI003AAD2897
MTEPQDRQPRRSLVRAVAQTAAVQVVRKAAVATGGAVVSTFGWPAILAVLAVVAVAGALAILAIVAAFSRLSDQRADFAYQCESRLGFAVGSTAAITVVPRLATTVALDPATPPATTWETTPLQPSTTTTSTTTPTTTPTPPPTTTSTTPPSAPTTTNPYASMTIPSTADTNTRACAMAVKQGEVVGSPVHTPGTELGRQAAALANERVGTMATLNDGDTAGPTNDAFSPANLVRYAYYQASGGAVSLPHTVAEQITIGDRVDPEAIAAGDLVFFNFTATEGPTSVMIAVTPTIGVDATIPDQPISLGVLPTGNVVVKRPTLTERPATHD